MRPPPLRPKFFSISCSFWGQFAKSYVGAPPGGLAPPPTGNPGCAPDNHMVQETDDYDMDGMAVNKQAANVY